MENEQFQATQPGVEIDPWIEYLCQPPFSQARFEISAKKLMQQVLDAMQQGNSCLPAEQNSLSLLHDLVGDAQKAHSLAPFIYDHGQLYLYRYWALEKSVAEHVVRIQANSIVPVDLSEHQQQLLSDPYQQQALNMVVEQGLSMITGGPGTGKTFTLAHIIAVLNQALPNIRIAMAAPTGKAAQRMKEALQNALHSEALADFDVQALKQLQPVTLHRLLGLGNQAQPKFHAKQPLPYDVIVVDEASMLDLQLSQMLFAAVPNHARLILLGDADQLASVDVGSVLADLQQVSELKKNHVHLMKTRRFADGAQIGVMARFIQQDDMAQDVLAQFEQNVVQATELQPISLHDIDVDYAQLEYLTDEKLSASVLEQYYTKLMYGYADYVQALKQGQDQQSFNAYVAHTIEIFDQYRILTAIRHGAFGLHQLNMQIEQRLLNQLGRVKQGEWYEGRPVMMTYNDYQLGLSNGDIGICFLREHDGRSQFEVYFSSLEKWVLATRLPKNIETAFALTIHKSQGSEFAHTAVVLDHLAKNLLSKELIYTAITRAKKVVSLLVNRDAFTQALTIKTTRHSGLSQKIVEQYRNFNEYVN
ncbi:exodeoxyribonuclease V subunit alpha [Acinetobacter sp. NCu2D-2]|uniref:exodeoxyribonuclease V subunit alpha n=1 Tax=Acinetobacter sp. NCu2D-2 TaxID=1608473 RepID=UPI0007CDE81A|nr:exodeoxyribonuclease V subunit alpha [Acinetobacter sp. NCu2D-2]ANF80901.1 exodeoxyribonuclease V subunit alpha [Acinetobacter sp. NCu2D-2]